MADLTAQRTLVKSPPELWSELSEVESLARHLGELGEIRIVKVEPESTVAWEGEEVSGTVELEQSGWGTRVTFRATVPEPDLPQAPDSVVVEPEGVAVEPATVASKPDPPSAPAPAPRRERGGFLARWLFRERRPVDPSAGAAAQALESVTEESATVEMDAVTIPPGPFEDEAEHVGPDATQPKLDGEAERVQAILDGTLEALGQAHHRPFSRG